MAAPYDSEHQSLYPGGHEDWRPGMTCDECDERRAVNEAKRRKGPTVAGKYIVRPKSIETWLATGDPSAPGTEGL